MVFFRNLAPYVISIFAFLCVTCGYDSLQGKSTICDASYAICTSAKCIPDPEDDTKTICYCEVAKGKNFGKESCSKRLPYKDKSNVEHLTSTYSFVQYDTNKTMTCPSGNAWSYCLDKPCTIDPTDPKKAICSCDLKKWGDFVTLGGNCDLTTCKESYWSAASPEDTQGAMKILVEALGLKKDPSNYCPQ